MFLSVMVALMPTGHANLGPIPPCPGSMPVSCCVEQTNAEFNKQMPHSCHVVFEKCFEWLPQVFLCLRSRFRTPPTFPYMAGFTEGGK